MKHRIKSDALELALYDINNVQDLPGTQPSRLAQRLEPFKVWFRHDVLLSGARYHELDIHLDQEPVNILTQGWRSGSIMCCTLVGLCLCFNIVFTVYVTSKFPVNDEGIGDFGVQSCTSVLSATSKIHIVINLLATMLVGASNYNMQCLTAPTRRDVNAAHKRGSYLDVGIQSVRNLRFIPLWKSCLWFLLLISTLPLHLLWNSAVFSTTTTNTYATIVVSQDFLEARDIYGGLDCTDYGKYQVDDEESYATCWTLGQAKNNMLKKITPEACMRRYSNKLATDGFNLLAVTKSTKSAPSSFFPPANATKPVLAYFDSISYSPNLAKHCRSLCSDWCDPRWNCTSYCNSTTDAFGNAYNASRVSQSCYTFASNRSSWNPNSLTSGSDWICESDHVLSQGCTTQKALTNSTNWNILPENFLIDHCLASDAALMTCKLQYSSIILYFVIGCNTIKFFAILLHILCAKEPIMATVGDAVASFLRSADSATRGKCLHTTNVPYTDTYGALSQWEGALEERNHALRWERNAEWLERWSHGASWKHFLFTVLLWLTCLSVSVYYLVMSLLRSGTKSILSDGFGTMNLDALVSASDFEGGSAASILTTSILVNLPQVLFSSLYFTYNSIYTSMASAYEWSQFSRTRKSLRVTARVGKQRSSYWLQLPFKFSLPLLIVSTALHWLISQSVFLTNLTIRGPSNLPTTPGDEYLVLASDDGLITVIGYSPQAMVCAISVGILMIITLLIVSQFKLTPGMPLVGSNSFAISAACHAPVNDKDAATNPVMWGAISHQSDNSPGHCCFTSLEVDRPRVGEFYAGPAVEKVRKNHILMGRRAS